MSKGIVVDGLSKSLNSILSLRDKIGIIHEVFLVTRRWSGGARGVGDYQDHSIKIEPTPGIKQFSHELSLREGGAVRQGDVLLKNVSAVSYPNESDLDCSSDPSDEAVERFYVIGEGEYSVINVQKKLMTWNILLRRRSGT